MKHFIVKITTAALVMALIGWMVFSLFLPGYYLQILPVMLVFFLVITILVHAYLLRVARKDMAKFTRINILITFFKLVVYSVFAVVYLALRSENAIPFVICLMIIYLVFSFIEVKELSRISRK
jgi:hypothetical protein